MISGDFFGWNFGLGVGGFGAPALPKGRRHPVLGPARQRTLIYYQPGRLERQNRELRRREKLSMVWHGMLGTERNLLELQQIQGRLNQTT